MNEQIINSMKKYAETYHKYLSTNKKMLSKVKHEIASEDDIIKTTEILEDLSKSLLELKLDYVDMIEEEF